MSRSNKPEKKPTALRAAQRGIWYFMRTLLLIAFVALLCYGVFTTAYRAANMYILATEGLQLRAECALMNGDREALKEYFTTSFLEKDELLLHNAYDDFTISAFDYRVEVNGFSVWPWSSTASFTVTARMHALNGVIREDRIPENALEGAEYPLPEWTGGKYTLRFRLSGGRWYMYQMQLLEEAPSPAPLRTPDMSITPIPAVSGS